MNHGANINETHTYMIERPATMQIYVLFREQLSSSGNHAQTRGNTTHASFIRVT